MTETPADVVDLAAVAVETDSGSPAILADYIDRPTVVVFVRYYG